VLSASPTMGRKLSGRPPVPRRQRRRRPDPTVPINPVIGFEVYDRRLRTDVPARLEAHLLGDVALLPHRVDAQVSTGWRIVTTVAFVSAIARVSQRPIWRAVAGTAAAKVWPSQGLLGIVAT
jgi:hypothetical protein